MTGSEHGANEGEVGYGEYEPDWNDYKDVLYGCGHQVFSDREDEPGAAEVCCNCQPCPACGEKYSDCACPVVDPFAD